MIDEGKIVLFQFPQTDQTSGKLRPACVLSRLPGKYDDLYDLHATGTGDIWYRRIDATRRQ